MDAFTGASSPYKSAASNALKRRKRKTNASRAIKWGNKACKSNSPPPPPIRETITLLSFIRFFFARRRPPMQEEEEKMGIVCR